MICSIILLIWNFVNCYWCWHPTYDPMPLFLLGKRVLDVFIKGSERCSAGMRFHFLYVLMLHTYFKWLRSNWVLVFIPICCVSSHLTSLLEDLLADHSRMSRLVWMRLLSQILFLSLWISIHVWVVILLLNRRLTCYVRYMSIASSTRHVVVEHFQIYLDKLWWFYWICDHLIGFLVIIIWRQLILLYRIRYFLASRLIAFALHFFCFGSRWLNIS